MNLEEELKWANGIVTLAAEIRRLRAELDSMTASRKAAAAWGELWRVRCARAVDELAVARAELAVSVGHLSRLAEAYGCEDFTSAVDAALAAKEGRRNEHLDQCRQAAEI